MQARAQDALGRRIAHKDGAERRLHEGLGGDLRERPLPERADELDGACRILVVLEVGRELQRGLGELDGLPRAVELRAVDLVRPAHQLVVRVPVPAAHPLQRLGEELGARARVRIVEEAVGGALAEARLVAGLREGAEVVIEPPAQPRIGAVAKRRPR